MSEARKIFEAPYQLRQDYGVYDTSKLKERAHHLFQLRTDPRNFHPGHLRYTARMLESALRGAPDDNQLKFELAFVRLQNQPSSAAILSAERLIAEVKEKSIHRLGDVQDLKDLCAAMGRRALSGPESFTVKKINWAVSNRCPMLCRGCYHIFSGQPLLLNDALRVADKIAEHGAQNVVISGGDPLLWAPVYKLLEYLRGLGVRLALDATAYTLDRGKAMRICQSVELLRLPLDGSTEEVQSKLRISSSRDLLRRFRAALNICDDMGFTGVIVHTMASAANIHDLHNIAAELRAHRCVRQWVIFQWSDRRAPLALLPKLSASTEEIGQIVLNIRANFPELSVYFAPYHERVMGNLFIQSNGLVTTFAPGWGADLIVGDILRESFSEITIRPGVDRAAITKASLGSADQFGTMNS